MVDCGDVVKQKDGRGQTAENITAAIRSLLSRGAVPVVLGTDEGGAIAVMRAYDI
ncbi:MAG: hypothetical protein JRF38_10340 [Deltaproteobacteria bacterium]|nr:hypothetical protein [Deltaproteobacteria bacterium]